MKLTEKPRLFSSKQGDYFSSNQGQSFWPCLPFGWMIIKRGSWSWAEITHVKGLGKRLSDCTELHCIQWLPKDTSSTSVNCVAMTRQGEGIVWRWQPLHHAWLLHLLAVDSGSRTADTAVPGGRGQPGTHRRPFSDMQAARGPSSPCKSSSRANH